MARKRSAGQSGMRIDYTGGTFLWGWGHERKMMKRIERARRKLVTAREIREQTAPEK